MVLFEACGNKVLLPFIKVSSDVGGNDDSSKCSEACYLLQGLRKAPAATKAAKTMQVTMYITFKLTFD